MRRIAIVLLAVGFFSQSLFALGALYARRPLSNETGVPLWLKSYDAQVTIQDQIAVTHVDHVFRNETYSRLEGIFIFPLPKNAVVTELALWINGQRVIADVMEKDTARAVYESIVRKQIDPALLEYMGENVFKLSVFPIEPVNNPMGERRIEITYAELLPYESGTVDYRFFMKTANLTSKAVGRASLTASLTAQTRVLGFTSPTYGIGQGLSITKVNDNSYSAIFGNENADFAQDLVFKYSLSEQNFALNHLTYVPGMDSAMFFDAPGDNPYFLLWVTPPSTQTSQQVIAKNVVFVADVSSSMAGTRIQQVRSALNTMVDMLNPIDRFNIISFGTAVSSFRGNLVSVSAQTKTDAHVFVNNLVEFGLTNMEEAFKAAFAQSWGDTTVNTVVFLTDGRPTWPVTTSRQAVLDSVRRENAQGDVAVFPFGIGEGIDDTLLTALADQNSGVYYPIGSDDSIAALLTGFMNRISHPLIKNCTLALNGLQAYDIFPKQLPNLYAGTQLTVLGRYRTAGTFSIGFGGTQGAREIILQDQLAFPAGVKNHPFVPRMWASAKIDELLAQIKIYGEQKELVDAVKVLSVKYNIVTPYTSMLVLEPANTRTIEDKLAVAPTALRLFQNTPNPVTASTTIRYAVPATGAAQRVTLEIFDARGRLIKSLVNEIVMGGNFLVAWNADDHQGRRVASGTYLAVLKVGKMRQMIRIKVE